MVESSTACIDATDCPLREETVAVLALVDDHKRGAIRWTRWMMVILVGALSALFTAQVEVRIRLAGKPDVSPPASFEKKVDKIGDAVADLVTDVAVLTRLTEDHLDSHATASGGR
jgi:hypothetical protein